MAVRTGALPGQFMRGRHTYGILTQLGVTETIARDKDDYVNLAVRLGLDAPAGRTQIVMRMNAAHRLFYSDTRSVRALEDIYWSAVRRCGVAV